MATRRVEYPMGRESSHESECVLILDLNTMTRQNIPAGATRRGWWFRLGKASDDIDEVQKAKFSLPWGIKSQTCKS